MIRKLILSSMVAISAIGIAVAVSGFFKLGTLDPETIWVDSLPPTEQPEVTSVRVIAHPGESKLVIDLNSELVSGVTIRSLPCAVGYSGSWRVEGNLVFLDTSSTEYACTQQVELRVLDATGHVFYQWLSADIIVRK